MFNLNKPKHYVIQFQILKVSCAQFCSQINQNEQLLFCLLLFALLNMTGNKSNFLSFSFNQDIEILIFMISNDLLTRKKC